MGQVVSTSPGQSRLTATPGTADPPCSEVALEVVTLHGDAALCRPIGTRTELTPPRRSRAGVSIAQGSPRMAPSETAWTPLCKRRSLARHPRSRADALHGPTDEWHPRGWPAAARLSAHYRTVREGSDQTVLPGPRRPPGAFTACPHTAAALPRAESTAQRSRTAPPEQSNPTYPPCRTRRRLNAKDTVLLDEASLSLFSVVAPG